MVLEQTKIFYFLFPLSSPLSVSLFSFCSNKVLSFSFHFPFPDFSPLQFPLFFPFTSDKPKSFSFRFPYFLVFLISILPFFLDFKQTKNFSLSPFSCPFLLSFTSNKVSELIRSHPSSHPFAEVKYSSDDKSSGVFPASSSAGVGAVACRP